MHAFYYALTQIVWDFFFGGGRANCYDGQVSVLELNQYIIEHNVS